jgi:uncharacterized membrane protein (UPF0127 family)
MKFIWNICALALATALFCACDGKPIPAPTTQSAPPAEWQPTEAQPRLPAIELWVGPAQITAEIASTSREIQTGMMFRTNVVEDEGMLFVFREPHQVSFWMKNCPKPLSCAYIDPQGTILEMYPMEPHNTNGIVARSDNILFVLETARGWFERHGVRTNMVVQTERGPLLQTFFGTQAR